MVKQSIPQHVVLCAFRKDDTIEVVTAEGELISVIEDPNAEFDGIAVLSGYSGTAVRAFTSYPAAASFVVGHAASGNLWTLKVRDAR